MEEMKNKLFNLFKRKSKEEKLLISLRRDLTLALIRKHTSESTGFEREYRARVASEVEFLALYITGKITIDPKDLLDRYYINKYPH